ncbi:MAG: beta-ketoacyl synthase N-terminal-like domain-containing protein [Verrucomicrobiota bacterium]
MKSSARIVITGVGAVCGAGLTVETIWNLVQSGKSAVAPITHWDAARWPVRHAAEVKGVSDTTLVGERKFHKFLSRTDLFGLYAADIAIQESCLIAHRAKMDPASATFFNDRSGVFVGSGGGTYQNSYDFFPALTVSGGDLQIFGREIESCVNPMWLLTRLPNNVLCYIGIRYGLKGTNACITNQCVGGVLAVAEAAAAIRWGEADRAVVAGHDVPIEPETLFHYHELGLMAHDTLRPFDQCRGGTIFGEGAASIVLEKEVDARARQAHVRGEFLGSGCTTEATGLVAVRPDGDGLSRAIELALADADIAPGRVGLVVAHGNGTRMSDASEAMAIRRVFGDNPPPVTAFKWAFGHSIAASGILDLVLALATLEHGVVPGIGTLECLDPELAPLPVSRSPQSPRSDIALVLSRGFGGMNVALLVQAATGKIAG